MEGTVQVDLKNSGWKNLCTSRNLPCLDCGKVFLSTNIKIRVCNECKDTIILCNCGCGSEIKKYSKTMGGLEKWIKTS